MSKYIAFLRAINVAGHGSVKMVDLNRAFVSAGCKAVRTVIQSGNVLFETPDRQSSSLLQKVQVEVSELLGTEATILFRRLSEVEEMVKARPFKELEHETASKFYVAFLMQKPKRKPALPLLVPKEGLEALKALDREVFVVSRRKANGMYGFPNNFVEAEFGVPSTTRNWSTLKRIVDLSS